MTDPSANSSDPKMDFSQFFQKLAQSTLAYNNFSQIFCKAHNDGYVETLYKAFDAVIQKEKYFAVQR